MEKKDYLFYIANTINRQLFGLTPLSVWGSWGVSRKGALKYNGSYEGMPALAFDVNGFLWKGAVVIALDEGLDYYEIWLDDFKGNRRMVADQIGCEQLGEVVDRHVETGDDLAEYDRRREEWLRGQFLEND